MLHFSTVVYNRPQHCLDTQDFTTLFAFVNLILCCQSITKQRHDLSIVPSILGPVATLFNPHESSGIRLGRWLLIYSEPICSSSLPTTWETHSKSHSQIFLLQIRTLVSPLLCLLFNVTHHFPFRRFRRLLFSVFRQSSHLGVSIHGHCPHVRQVHIPVCW